MDTKKMLTIGGLGFAILLIAAVIVGQVADITGPANETNRSTERISP